MKIKVEFWNRHSGEIDSHKDWEKEWEGTEEEIFAKFYHENNSYRYCNGTYFKFADPAVEKKYRTEFFPKYHTIENFYRGGVVD